MLGIDRHGYWAHQFGFGAPTGIDLPAEARGHRADATSGSRTRFGLPIYPGEVYHAGIGQGYDAVTPLQLLNAYAALANGGTLYRPHVVRRDHRPGRHRARRRARGDRQGRRHAGRAPDDAQGRAGTWSSSATPTTSSTCRS